MDVLRGSERFGSVKVETEHPATGTCGSLRSSVPGPAGSLSRPTIAERRSCDAVGGAAPGGEKETATTSLSTARR
jgi:hypothetical protein